MLSIQEVGTEILTNKPRKFYIFTGSEYGIKERYIKLLADLYGSKREVQSVNSILDTMSRKHVFALEPSVYVVRYDEDFVSSLDERTSRKIDSAKIIGTIVCLYEDSKQCTKIEKYLDNYTVSIGAVSIQFIRKYLHQDFPGVPDRIIDLAAETASDYNQAKIFCNLLNKADLHKVLKLSDEEVLSMFGKNSRYKEDKIKEGVASRNFQFLLSAIDSYDGDVTTLYYTMLSVMLELDKLLDNKYADSSLKKYVSMWGRLDIYNFFSQVYDQLNKSRSQSIDIKNSLMYLCSILQFSPIPVVQGD